MDNKTIFNYIGGKTWLKEYLRKELTLQLANQVKTHKTQNLSFLSYCEPFAGGLGAFLNLADILLMFQITSINLNDINHKLINFYECVNHHKDKLIQEYLLLETEYQKTLPQALNTLHRTKDQVKLKPLLKSSNEFYNNVRKDFNQQSSELNNSTTINIQLATKLLFLQNHCFNGVYRENLKGEHNTPYNWESKIFNYKKTIEKIEKVSQLFNLFNIKFTTQSFNQLNFNSSTIYYLDPPYINEDIAENKYHKDVFSKKEQLELIHKLKNTIFIYSNHYNEILLNEFKKENINIQTQSIARKNIMSASPETRKIDKLELLISSKNE